MQFSPFTVEQLQTPEGVAQLNEFLQDVVSFMPISIKKGATQAAAGAAVNELWVDTDDNTVKIGV
jgi:hypothetical protein